MELGVQEYIDGLLTKAALETPSNKVKPEDVDVPEWFDGELYNKGRKFFWQNCYAFSLSIVVSLVAVLSVPSILLVVMGSRRSNSTFTSYKRYSSTLLHVLSWFEEDLKPGSKSWKSLKTVRGRHFRATQAAQVKGQGMVSQRDVALTQGTGIIFVMLKPDKFGIRQLSEGDWEAYNHFWRVIGYFLGLEDRYNLCRKNIDETREVCQILLDRVFTPCLTNVPEHFEHMVRCMLEGLSIINSTVHVEAMMYWTKYLANVPGYFCTEEERIDLEKRIKQHLKGKSNDIGVDASELVHKSAVGDQPGPSPRLYLRDFSCRESSPAYNNLDNAGKFKLAYYNLTARFYSTWLGHWYYNMQLRFGLLIMKYFPFTAFFKFGVKEAYVNIFVESPVDDTEAKPNSEYYKVKQNKSW